MTRWEDGGNHHLEAPLQWYSLFFWGVFSYLFGYFQRFESYLGVLTSSRTRSILKPLQISHQDISIWDLCRHNFVFWPFRMYNIALLEILRARGNATVICVYLCTH